MPKIVSKFSNGHVDVYNGKRDVKAGWMITGPAGDFLTGHSYDAPTARKTAESKAPYLTGAPMTIDRPNGRRDHLARKQYFNGIARERGFASWQAMYVECSAKLAAFRAQCKIEVVAL
jgi:hypothetical protein